MAVLLSEPHGMLVDRIVLKRPRDLLPPRLAGLPLFKLAGQLRDCRLQGGDPLFQSYRGHETLQVPQHVNPQARPADQGRRLHADEGLPPVEPARRPRQGEAYRMVARRGTLPR